LVDLIEKDGAVFFTVRVAPRASKSEIAGMLGGALKVRIGSPPVEGAANAELIGLLAKTFDVARGRVEIVSGHASKTKRIRISGIAAERISAVLQAKI
jgi:uncharacterized protein (TIGR00251 family)